MATNTNQGNGKQSGQRKTSSQKQMSAQRRKAKKRNRIIIFTVEILVIAVLLGALYMLRDFGKTGINRIEIDEQELNIAPEVTESELTKGYRNIVLFGVDSTGGALESRTRSDSIIIASINMDSGDVKLMSVYRDTYLYLGNEKTDKYDKCNTAYSQGGAKQAMKMLNTNLDLNISDFVTIGFRGLRDVIDALGGIEIEITNAEIRYLNDYQLTMSEDLKCDYEPVEKAGLQTLNGLQSVAYCRIRYTKGDDFKRTERQRDVIQAIVDKVKAEKNASKLIDIANEVADDVYTSLDMEEILGILGEVSKYRIVDEAGFPIDKYRSTGEMGSSGDCVLPMDLEKNVTWMYEFLFEEENYTPSSTVKQFSEEIRAKVKNYQPDLKYPTD